MYALFFNERKPKDEESKSNPIYVIDGNNIDAVESFNEEFTKALNITWNWERNSNALIDVLKQYNPCTIIGKNSELSK